MPDSGRIHDLTELYRARDRAWDKVSRKYINRSIDLIKQESGLVRSMREKLIMAHRAGDMEEVKDIHDFIAGKSRYQRIND